MWREEGEASIVAIAAYRAVIIEIAKLRLYNKFFRHIKHKRFLCKYPEIVEIIIERLIVCGADNTYYLFFGYKGKCNIATASNVVVIGIFSSIIFFIFVHRKCCSIHL